MENPGIRLAWFWHIPYGRQSFLRLVSARPSEHMSVFRAKQAYQKTLGGFQVATGWQNGSPGHAFGEEKAAEQVIFPTISVIFDRGTVSLWPNSMTQMI